MNAENHMKRKLLFALVLVLGLLLLLCGCNPTPTPGPETPDNPDTPEPPAPVEPLELISEGEAKFQIVLSSSLSAKNKTLVQKYIAEFAKLGVTLKKADDYRADKVTDCELLVGQVKNRDEQVGDPHSLGEKGYSVTVNGKKVVLTGGSDSALSYAIEEFFDYLLDHMTETLTLLLPGDFASVHPQEYDITSVTVSGVSLREFGILYDANDSEASASARLIQSEVYAKTGIFLNFRSNAGAHNLYVRSSAEAGDGGFTVKVDENGDLLVLCKYKNRFESATNTFLLATFFGAEGDMKFNSDYQYTKDISKVYYSEFGAKGDGVTDDLEAIIAAHEFANAGGETVCADPGATYYIAMTGKTAIVRTDVDWGDARFIIDDRKVTLKERSTSIFLVESANKPTYREIPEGYTLARNATNLGMTFDGPRMVIIYCDTDLIYKRYNEPTQANGIAKSDVLLVDKDGNIDPSTPLVWSYENGVTRMRVYEIDDTPVTLRGGNFTTIVNTQPFRGSGGYYERGIRIARSNTVVEGLRHEVVENEDSCPYYGILMIANANNVTVRDSYLSGRKSYSGGANYEFNINEANNILFYNVRQINSITDTSLWGIMASSASKNLVYDKCYLSRYDDHRGLCNGAIRNSEIGQIINLIGTGTFLIENSVIRGQQLVTIRADYGASWEGDIIIKDSTFVPKGNTAYIVKAWWHDYDPGYLCYFPNIKIDGLKIVGDATVYFTMRMVDYVIDDIANHPNHPYIIPQEITVRNVTDAQGKALMLDIAQTDAVKNLFKNTTFTGGCVKKES